MGGDQTSDFRALPWLLAKVYVPRWDDIMTLEKMQDDTLLSLETGRCHSECKQPAAMKIALADSSVKKMHCLRRVEVSV